MHTLVDRGPPGPLSSAYVHIPFCRDRCIYCAFATIADDSSLHERVVQALLAELRRHDFDGSWRTIYLGGGTPGLLDPAQLGKLLDGIRSLGGPHGDLREVTLEANPANINPSTLAQWSDLGVTRLSVGVQTFNDDALKALARLHDAATARAALRLISENWSGTWSADLLLGWEGQTDSQLADDLRELAALTPPHISAYPLEIEPKTALLRLVQNNNKRHLNYSQIYIKTQLFEGLLAPSGLQRYEVSNFARSGHESHHNQAYWANSEYLGVGPGACSSRGSTRWANFRDTRTWLAQVEAGRSARARAEHVSPSQRLLESLAIGLRTAAGVSRSELDRRFGPDWLPVLEHASREPLEDLGLELEADRLIAPDEQRLRIDAILAHIARNWPEPEPAFT